MTYNKETLRQLFRNKYNDSAWIQFLHDFFHSTELRAVPERIAGTSDEEPGFYIGALDTSDSYRIGLFHYVVAGGDVKRKRVGLRQLVKRFINPNWGEFDAALVVFSGSKHWRLSLVCDIKGEATAPKRFTYVFGEDANYYNTPVDRFITLQAGGFSFDNIRAAFSVEALTKQFYTDLFEWYLWAVDDKTRITFPNNTAIEDDDRENINVKIIRLITRIMFVWFIKQKHLVPVCLFNKDFLRSILKDFDPLSTDCGNYYNAILQNLFFATLNRAIVDEDGAQRAFAHTHGKDLKTLYRYAEMFSVSEDEVIRLFAQVPFLNGGLFECLDKTKMLDGVERAYNYDGFSRNEAKFADGRYRNRAFVPNILFFEPERGLFSILSRYNFTIEENTPNEQQVALDPELLGKVFENLLGAYNPETKETARNQSGSFYTPREIVNFMVDESLLAYLGKSDTVLSLFGDDFTKDPTREAEYQQIAAKLKAIKVLDPACGSGAFPMGLLNRMVDILQKIQPTSSVYELKLPIIENCIYGSDIQSIAAQISKLRFFISLICDCEKDASKPNFGIPTLPNLETKFVSANSLLQIKRVEQHDLFEDPEIEPTKQALAEVRHRHFSAKSAAAKRRLRDKDRELRSKLARLLAENDCFAPGDAKQLAAWNPYDQNAVADFFDPEWMFGVKDGFDIVIGNPPYIQLQNNRGELAQLYEPCGYKTFARKGDIYCLFYERGQQLLKRGGHLCYITSNKWMRAGYGENTRLFFATQTDPQLLIDFAGVKIFESATVDTNILLFSKAENRHNTLCAVTNKQNKDSVKNLSVFVQQNGSVCDFSSSDSWVILSPIEQSIKKKIEAVGTPLKDWNIQINYGIKTGCNEAFIIDTAKREEILANCLSEEERERTDALIRPILRGRDIKRYGYNWANLWLINTHNGIRGKLERIHIEDYPAVKAHLDQYWDKISTRADKGDTPYNLRNCAYLDDFSKPKIVYQELSQGSSFALDEEGKYTVANTAYLMVGNHLQYLFRMLNSQLIEYAYKRFYGTLIGTSGLRWLYFNIIELPIPIFKDTPIIHKLITANKEVINQIVYSLYSLNTEEIEFIESLQIQ